MSRFFVFTVGGLITLIQVFLTYHDILAEDYLMAFIDLAFVGVNAWISYCMIRKNEDALRQHER